MPRLALRGSRVGSDILGGARSRSPNTLLESHRRTPSPEFCLAPAGTPLFGPNQCKNDKDGTVDHDERLRSAGVEPGIDAKFTDVKGRTWVVRTIEIETGKNFSIEESELTSCTSR